MDRVMAMQQWLWASRQYRAGNHDSARECVRLTQRVLEADRNHRAHARAKAARLRGARHGAIWDGLAPSARARILREIGVHGSWTGSKKREYIDVDGGSKWADLPEEVQMAIITLKGAK